MAEPLELLADLADAIREAHTPRALVREIAARLAARMRVTYVAIGSPVLAAIESIGGVWRAVEPARNAVAIVPGLAVRGTVAAYVRDDDFKRALASVIAAALRHLDVVQRVAQLSRKAHAENRELRHDLERLADAPAIVARSAAMREVLQRAALVAKHATTVLVTGESGTGKEVLAHEIHRLSPRAHRPMIQINCGAIPDTLIESELFGHERGAFTGADRRHIGVFERGHRTTLFLDEIGELSPAAQTKLLRVLQNRTFRRVGGTEHIEVDVRLIAATNRSLPALVRAGTFREDLYYRINVFALALPPLRDRREDIAPLVGALVKQLAARHGFTPPPIPRAVMAQLEEHDWPGNVRELANVLESALIVGEGKRLELPVQLATRPHRRDKRFDASIAQVIESALRATRGKIYGKDGAAAQLGLPPGTLQSKMRKLGIRRDAFR